MLAKEFVVWGLNAFPVVVPDTATVVKCPRTGEIVVLEDSSDDDGSYETMYISPLGLTRKHIVQCAEHLAHAVHVGTPLGLWLLEMSPEAISLLPPNNTPERELWLRELSKLAERTFSSQNQTPPAIINRLRDLFRHKNVSVGFRADFLSWPEASRLVSHL